MTYDARDDGFYVNNEGVVYFVCLKSNTLVHIYSKRVVESLIINDDGVCYISGLMLNNNFQNAYRRYLEEYVSKVIEKEILNGR